MVKISIVPDNSTKIVEMIEESRKSGSTKLEGKTLEERRILFFKSLGLNEDQIINLEKKGNLGQREISDILNKARESGSVHFTGTKEEKKRTI